MSVLMDMVSGNMAYIGLVEVNSKRYSRGSYNCLILSQEADS